MGYTEITRAEQLRDYFANNPEYGRENTTLKVLQALMLGPDMMLRGEMWAFQSKRRCPGVYEVWLERRN